MGESAGKSLFSRTKNQVVFVVSGENQNDDPKNPDVLPTTPFVKVFFYWSSDKKVTQLRTQTRYKVGLITLYRDTIQQSFRK